MNTRKMREPRRCNSVRKQALIYIAIIITGMVIIGLLYNSVSAFEEALAEIT